MDVMKHPEALLIADRLKERYGQTVPTSQAAAELRRLHSVNAELLAALRALYVAAPTSANCNDFHHSASERHAFGAECKPVADYLAALAGARVALAAPATQEAQ